MHASNTLRSIAACLLGASLVASATVGSAQSAKPSAKPAAQEAQAVAPIDINSASESELEALPGVGPSRARAIVETRTRMNGFQRVEDLMRVKGIGRKTFRDLQPLVKVGPAPKASGSSKPAKP